MQASNITIIGAAIKDIESISPDGVITAAATRMIMIAQPRELRIVRDVSRPSFTMIMITTGV